MKKEIIPNTSGSYEVFEDGSVFSLERSIPYNDGRKNRIWPRKKIKMNTDSNGYLSFMVSNGSKTKRMRLHRVVAQAFIPNPDNKPQVNHKDGNIKNNHVNNLEWATGSENIRHSYLTRSTGAGISRTAKPIKIYKDGLEFYYHSIKDAISKIGGSHSGLSHALHGRTPTFKGYKAEFV